MPTQNMLERTWAVAVIIFGPPDPPPISLMAPLGVNTKEGDIEDNGRLNA